MIEQQAPAREALPSIETNPPSPALKVRIAHGVFDKTALPDMPLPEKVNQKTFDALHNQNVRQRQKDAADFAQRFANNERQLSPEEMRHEQMKVWSEFAVMQLATDLKPKGRGDKTAIILREKLKIPLKGDESDGKILLDQFYNADTKAEGDFYKNFCTGNMNENLANALTLDDMMHLKPFLTKWMLGSETAFNALVALKTTMDDLASSDPARKQALSQSAATQVTGTLDNQILTFYRDGLENKTEKLPSPIAGLAESIGGRPTMEDAHTVERNLNGKQGQDFFAIYDGHGGKAVADIASQTLHKYLAAALAEGKQPQDALRIAYAQTQQQLQHNSVVGGATAITALFDGDKIVIGNLGDARAVLIHENLQTERLSRDMKANDPEEQKAVEARGGKIDQNRVLGKGYTYAISGALGDNDVSGLQREPDIKEVSRMTSDKWLVLACDGIWDVIADQEIPTIIGDLTDPQQAAQALLKEASSRGSTDNLSAIAVKLT